MAQTESHANPPTFLLTLEKLLRDRQKPDARPQSPHEAEFFKAMLPALSQWFDWFRTTQKGPPSDPTSRFSVLQLIPSKPKVPPPSGSSPSGGVAAIPRTVS